MSAVWAVIKRDSRQLFALFDYYLSIHTCRTSCTHHSHWFFSLFSPTRTTKPFRLHNHICITFPFVAGCTSIYSTSASYRFEPLHAHKRNSIIIIRTTNASINTTEKTASSGMMAVIFNALFTIEIFINMFVRCACVTRSNVSLNFFTSEFRSHRSVQCCRLRRIQFANRRLLSFSAYAPLLFTFPPPTCNSVTVNCIHL